MGNDVTESLFSSADIEAAKEKLGRAIIQKTIAFDDFLKGIFSGTYSDDKGFARLVLNDSLNVSYNVYIDRMCVTKVGSVITFESLRKTYGAENIQFLYSPRAVLLAR